MTKGIKKQVNPMKEKAIALMTAVGKNDGFIISLRRKAYDYRIEKPDRSNHTYVKTLLKFVERERELCEENIQLLKLIEKMLIPSEQQEREQAARTLSQIEIEGGGQNE